MKEAPERVLNRNGLRYSAADKLKVMKLYFKKGYQARDIAQELGIGKSSLGKWIRERTARCSATSFQRTL